MQNDEAKKTLHDLRKLEKQAKQLIFNMNRKIQRLESEWTKVRKDLPELKSVPRTLGDALANWSKLNR